MSMNAMQRLAMSIGLMIINAEEQADKLAAAQARIAELEAKKDKTND